MWKNLVVENPIGSQSHKVKSSKEVRGRRAVLAQQLKVGGCALAPSRAYIVIDSGFVKT